MCSPTKVVTKEFYNPKKPNQKKKLGVCEVRGSFYDVDGKKIYFSLGAKDFLKSHDLYLRINCLSQGRREWVPITGTEPAKNSKKQVLTW